MDPGNWTVVNTTSLVNGRLAFVASANFAEAAQRRIVEVGSLVRSAPFAARLADHFESLCVTGLLRRLQLPSNVGQR